MKHTLPPELMDRIIDNLRGDQGSLCNCALACRAWLPRSRHNLFRTMEIHSLAALKSLVALSHDPRFLPHFTALRELCLYEHPTVSLSFSCSNPHQPFGDFIENKELPFMPLVPPLLARFISKVSVLRLEAVEWHMCQLDPTSLWFSSRFDSVVSLTLRNNYFSSFEELQRFLCALSSLSELVLHGIQWHLDMLPHWQIAHNRSTPPRLTSLDIRDCPRRESNALVEWLLLDLTRGIQSLRHLRLKDDIFDTTLIQKIASFVGPFLETLAFDLSNSSRGILQFPTGDLKSFNTSCTALLSLHFRSSRSTSISPLARLLSSWESRVLRHIKLDIATDTDSNRTFLKQLRSWRQVDEALAHERFARLESVVIIWRFQCSTLSDTRTIALAKPYCQFPKLRALGILDLTLRSPLDTVIYHHRR